LNLLKETREIQFKLIYGERALGQTVATWSQPLSAAMSPLGCAPAADAGAGAGAALLGAAGDGHAQDPLAIDAEDAVEALRVTSATGGADGKGPQASSAPRSIWFSSSTR